jgi:hypothetical protein
VRACVVEGCGREASVKQMCFRHYMRLRRSGKLTTTRRMGGFWEKVSRASEAECWPWTGYMKESGHGLTSYKSMPIHASRKAWILTHGPIADELCVCHRCDNAACCNPSHMYLGTKIDNMIDRFEHTPSDERGQRSRSTVLTTEQIGQMYQLRREGATLQQCADTFGVCRETVRRYVLNRRKERLAKLRSDRLAPKEASEV